MFKSSLVDSLLLYVTRLVDVSEVTAFKNGVINAEFTKYHLNSLPHNPDFKQPWKKKKAFWKHCGKRRKCWSPAFSPFPTMFSTLPKTNFNFSFTFVLSSANTFNLEQPKKIPFGEDLKHFIVFAQPCHPITIHIPKIFIFKQKKI